MRPFVQEYKNAFLDLGVGERVAVAHGQNFFNVKFKPDFQPSLAMPGAVKKIKNVLKLVINPFFKICFYV